MQVHYDPEPAWVAVVETEGWEYCGKVRVMVPDQDEFTPAEAREFAVQYLIAADLADAEHIGMPGTWFEHLPIQRAAGRRVVAKLEAYPLEGVVYTDCDDYDWKCTGWQIWKDDRPPVPLMECAEAPMLGCYALPFLIGHYGPLRRKEGS